MKNIQELWSIATKSEPTKIAEKEIPEFIGFRDINKWDVNSTTREKFIIAIMGQKSFNIGQKNKETGYAILSGYKAAKVLGVTSEKIRITKVNIPAEAAMAVSPQSFIAISVVIAEASILTKLFNRRIKLKVLSGLFKRYKTLFADLLPFLYLCFNLYLLTLINEVSDPEKKADKKRSNTRSMNKFSIVRVCIYLK